MLPACLSPIKEKEPYLNQQTNMNYMQIHIFSFRKVFRLTIDVKMMIGSSTFLTLVAWI